MKTLATQDRLNDKDSEYQNLAKIIYILQGSAFFFGGVTFIIALVLGYLKLPNVRGTWLEAHYRWQLLTNWVALAALLVGMLTVPYLFGYVVLSAAVVWVVHRIVLGWIRLNKTEQV